MASLTPTHPQTEIDRGNDKPDYDDHSQANLRDRYRIVANDVVMPLPLHVVSELDRIQWIAVPQPIERGPISLLKRDNRNLLKKNALSFETTSHQETELPIRTNRMTDVDPASEGDRSFHVSRNHLGSGQCSPSVAESRG